MAKPDPTNSPIIAAYREKTPTSERLAAEARQVFPSGITHDSRYLAPHGIYVERAEGGRKWDVDGNEYVDYFGGHGALLLGHNHPGVLAATRRVLAQGTHFGSAHEHELRWGQLIRKMMPGAERVRFTSSGTEATHLALRLARAFTDRRKFLRFNGHFHGWHDHVVSGYNSHFDGSPMDGVLPETAAMAVPMHPWDIDAVRQVLETDIDVAAAILEPTGATFGMVPLKPGFLSRLRSLTAEHGVVLIFDEVVTGFRVATGGAQSLVGVTPDLTTLAKVVSGGLPGGAVVGRKDILDLLDFEVANSLGREKIPHQGTYNANPVSAAAGLAALEIIAQSDACERANSFCQALRPQLNQVLEEQGVPWSAYGEFSAFHIFTNPRHRQIEPFFFDPFDHSFEDLRSNRPGVVPKLRMAMLLGGVDITGWPGGTATAAHTEVDLEKTVQAFSEALAMLRKEGEI
ncbi:MAG: aminotransferase class III-fold pyridoxal phosphate-dependent enzyme [Alphaproteobacteria bacterium]